MDVPLELVFGLLAMLGYGLSNAMAKVPARKLGSRNAIFLRGIFVSLLLLIILLSFSRETSFSPTYILIGFIISVVAYLGFNTFYKALELGKVGIVSPIANSSVIFTIVLSIFFFNESLTWIQVFSIVLITIGIMLISINFKDLENSHLFEISSGIPFALVTCLLWGLVFFLYKIPIIILGPILTSFIIEFGMLISAGTDLKISKTYSNLPNKKETIHIFFVALFGAAGTLFFSLGVNMSDVSVVAALAFANPLISTIYGKFLYKENLSIPQYVAIFLMLTGIILISYFQVPPNN